MASYFVYDDDKHLLHASVRDHAEASNMATVVERELIRHYTERISTTTFSVRLQGYAADADDVTQTGLVAAMKDAIAAIVSDRLREYSTRTGVTAESLGEYSYEREGGKGDRGFLMAEGILANYDCREHPWW